MAAHTEPELSSRRRFLLIKLALGSSVHAFCSGDIIYIGAQNYCNYYE